MSNSNDVKTFMYAFGQEVKVIAKFPNEKIIKLQEVGAPPEEAELMYKDSSKELKQRIRLHKIKFTKWINSQMINKEDNFIVPTMLDPNRYGEKLYD